MKQYTKNTQQVRKNTYNYTQNRKNKQKIRNCEKKENP